MKKIQKKHCGIFLSTRIFSAVHLKIQYPAIQLFSQYILVAAFLLISTMVSSVSAHESSGHENKTMGNNEQPVGMIKEIPSVKAFDLWAKNKDRVKIIDCRTREEFIAGHPEMASNIPIEFMINGSVTRNPDFEAEVRKIASETDTVMIICRTGRRSIIAANQIIKAGFSNVINISDGFEGKKGRDAGSAEGSGWKHSGLPWVRN